MFKSYREQKAKTQKPEKLVILFHGVGSNQDDMIELVPYFQDEMSDAHFISANGIEPYDMAPYGHQWFSIQNRNLEAMQNELARTHLTIKQCIKGHLANLELDYRNLILIGFSQGVMAGLYATLMNNLPIGAFIGFGGSFIPPSHNIVSAYKTPICLIHGEKDEVLPLEYMHKSAQFLRNRGLIVETHIVPNLGHSIDYSGIQKAIAFIKKNCYDYPGSI